MKKCQTPDSVLPVKCKMLSPGRGREHVVGCRLRREPYLFIYLVPFFFSYFSKTWTQVDAQQDRVRTAPTASRL